MISEVDIDLDELGRKYLVANTPGYLYRTLATTQTVQNLARKYSAQELIEEVAKLLVKDPLTVTDTIICYAAVVALGMKPLREVNDALIVLPIDRVSWLDDMLKMALSARQITQIGRVDMELPKPKLILPQTRLGSTSRIVSDLPSPKPYAQKSSPTSDAPTEIREIKLAPH